MRGGPRQVAADSPLFHEHDWILQHSGSRAPRLDRDGAGRQGAHGALLLLTLRRLDGGAGPRPLHQLSAGRDYVRPAFGGVLLPVLPGELSPAVRPRDAEREAVRAHGAGLGHASRRAGKRASSTTFRIRMARFFCYRIRRALDRARPNAIYIQNSLYGPAAADCAEFVDAFLPERHLGESHGVHARSRT